MVTPARLSRVADRMEREARTRPDSDACFPVLSTGEAESETASAARAMASVGYVFQAPPRAAPLPTRKKYREQAAADAK